MLQYYVKAPPKAGKRDAESSYDYFGARYYNNKLGIWLSADPLADKYPGWSPYNYVADYPVNLIDRYGMEPEDGDQNKEKQKEKKKEDDKKKEKKAGASELVVEYSLTITLPKFIELTGGVAVRGILGILSLVTLQGDTDPAQAAEMRAQKAENGEAKNTEETTKEKVKEHTPDTHPEEFGKVKGSKAKINKVTGEVFLADPQKHGGEHYEVYKNKKRWEQKKRDRAVWKDGKLKEIFK